MTNAQLYTRIREIPYKEIGRGLSYQHWIDLEESKVYVLFEGSNGLRDWFHNLLFLPIFTKPYRMMRRWWFCHWGFRRVWRSGNDQVIEETCHYLTTLKDHEVIFAGYSHGGALAQLAAEDFFFRFGIRCKCIVFGAPRLAWLLRSARHLRRSMILTNWRNRNDLITHVPFTFLGFFHATRDHLRRRLNPFWLLFRIHREHQIYGREDLYPS